MTREELYNHFSTSTVIPEDVWSHDMEMPTEVVYSLLPINNEIITETNNIIAGRTAIALGFTYNEKHYLKRNIEKRGGKFSFTKKDQEDFFIIYSGTWINDMLYALRKARQENAIIVDYNQFIKNFDEPFDNDEEERLKEQERNKLSLNKKNESNIKLCSQEDLDLLPQSSTNEISLEEDIFFVIGRINYITWDNDDYIKFKSQNDVYSYIDKKGGLSTKKESNTITCIVYGEKPSEEIINKYLGITKLIKLERFIEWLIEEPALNIKCKAFGKKFKATIDPVLRPYQQNCKNEIFKKWNFFYNVMLQLPTGTGKTVLFTSIIHDLCTVKGTKILILAHRKELIDQISEHLSRYNIKHGIIASGRVRTLELNVQVASVQTLTHEKNANIFEELNPQFIIIDEAHHSLAASYTKFWEKSKDCWKLGVTATPYRLNNKSFTSHFDKLIQVDAIDEFIKNGYLSDYTFLVDNSKSTLSKAIKSIKEKSSTGDYKTATLLSKLNMPEHIQRLIICYEQYAKGKKGIVYAISKEHAFNICNAYKAVGIEAVYIDSDTPKKERAEIVEQFAKSEVKVMVNVDIFSEGYDCPDVEFIQLARPTWSLAKYLQQVGRGLRPSLGKNKTIILDNSRMFVKFGMPSEKRIWDWHFTGDPYAKNLYKEEDIENESYLQNLCENSNEIMVEISYETNEITDKTDDNEIDIVNHIINTINNTEKVKDDNIKKNQKEKQEEWQNKRMKAKQEKEMKETNEDAETFPLILIIIYIVGMTTISIILLKAVGLLS